MQEEHTADIDVSAKKLTDWSNEPSVSDLKQHFIDTQSSHSEQTTKIRKWLDNLHVEGAAKPKTSEGRSSVQPKLIRKQAEWRYPALSEPFLNNGDIFEVSPVSWEDKAAAQQNQLVLNHQFNNRMDKVQLIDDYVRACVDEGTAILRVGWEFEEEEYQEMVPTIRFTENPELGPLHEELAQIKQNDPNRYQIEVPDELKQAHEMSMAEGVPYEAEVIGAEEQALTRTTKNHPTLDVCHYDDVIFDPSCMGKDEKAEFVIYRFQSSLSELERDGKYSNLDRINLQNNTILGEPDTGPDNEGSFNFADKPRQKFTVHEYWGSWDIDGSGVVRPIVAAWVGDTLVRLEENPFPDQRPPFITVPYLPVRRSLYGEPDGSLLEDNQRIIGAVTRGMIDLMGRSANGQTGIRKDALDVTNKRKFEKGQDYEFNMQVDPRQGIYMHQYPEIPQSAQFMVQSQNMEAESITGVQAFSQNGLSGASLGESATGIRGALDAASKRELSILRRLAYGMVKAGRKIIAMNQEFLDEGEVVRITNEEFVTIQQDDLVGHFDLKLDIATAEEDNAKAQELSFMLQTMGNNMDPAMSRMILADIARLKKMPALSKRIEEYQPEPDPMDQQIKQLEMQKLQTEIAKIESETMENQAEAQLDRAKARKESSAADMTDLDYVEQESGVKQERDLQKVGEQARSQQALKSMDHQYKIREKRQDRLAEYLQGNTEKDAG